MSWYSPEMAMRLSSAARSSGSSGVFYKRGRPIRVVKKGLPLTHDPLFNKATGFTASERERLGLRGLLPPSIMSLDQQYDRAMVRWKDPNQEIADSKPITKWNELQNIKHRNQTLYYKMLMENFPEMASIVYTPTVGQVCQQWHHLWMKPREMYFCPDDRGEMMQMVFNWPSDIVDLIVVTDGSRILGLGDLGANGAGIVEGKIELYVAGGGVDPARVLPIVLDVGTNNKALREDPFYLGHKKERLEGDEYYAMVDEFMAAVTRRWKNVMVHFEDFATPKARAILAKYQPSHFVFNDDIQGTAAVAVASFLAKLRMDKISIPELREKGGLKIVTSGAGSSAVGVMDMWVSLLTQYGFTAEEARESIYVLDSKGLIGQGSQNLDEEKTRYCRKDMPAGMSLLEVVKAVKPDVMLGSSACAGIFSEEVIREVAKHCERPLIMPMSNPTEKAECTAEQAFKWTDGKCVFASGSPFSDVTLADGTVRRTNQCNNFYIFPGHGVGAMLCGANRVNESMLFAASHALANYVSEEELAEGILFPRMNNIREVSAEVAAAVALAALETGVADGGYRGINWDSETLAEDLQAYMWTPEFSPYIDSTWQQYHQI